METYVKNYGDHGQFSSNQFKTIWKMLLDRETENVKKEIVN